MINSKATLKNTGLFISGIAFYLLILLGVLRPSFWSSITGIIVLIITIAVLIGWTYLIFRKQYYNTLWAKTSWQINILSALLSAIIIGAGTSAITYAQLSVLDHWPEKIPEIAGLCDPVCVEMICVILAIIALFLPYLLFKRVFRYFLSTDIPDDDIVIASEKQRDWTTRITPKTKLADFNLLELLSYRDLILLFFKRDVSTTYKQTVLGPLWLIITPLLTTVVYTVVFGYIFNTSTDGIPRPVFYLAGITMWTYFSTTFNGISRTFLHNSGVFGKIYFPRMTLPIATALTGLVAFIVSLIILVVMVIIYALTGTEIMINYWLCLVPVYIFQAAMLAMGMGLIISSLTTKYRDLISVLPIGTTLWMFLCPIMYSLTMVPDAYQTVYLLNPMAPIITMFKYAFFGTGMLPLGMWGISWITTIVIFIIGLMLFKKSEKNFLDTV